jgi:RING finger protein 113A
MAEGIISNSAKPSAEAPRHHLALAMPETSSSPKSSGSKIANMVDFKNPNKRCRANRRKATSSSLTEFEGHHEASLSDNEAKETVKRKRHTPTVTASSKDPKLTDKDMGVTLATADRDQSLVNGDEATRQAPAYNTMDNPRTTSLRRYGPTRAATNVRMITTRDNQFAICKDYKASGYCGRGDTCEFLRTREDYKQSYQLDQDSNASAQFSSGTVIGLQYETARDERDPKDEGPELNKPLACGVCTAICQNAVKASCGHFFCEGCALERYRRSTTCATCGTVLNGTFRAVKDSR